VEAVFGGVTIDNVINTGGAELVSAGGVDSGTTLRGVQFVQAGGQTFTTDVASGGAQIVQAGGLARSEIDGGSVDVQAGGTAFVGFNNLRGGQLTLEASTSFVGQISGFASPAGITEEIDLRDIAFNAATTKETFTQTGTSGTLTVTDGTHTANLTLLGQYSAHDFSLSSDGFGGTIVTDPLDGSGGHPVLAPPA
jgi:autotransporter passenger strand-loop-strand repeat protein